MIKQLLKKIKIHYLYKQTKNNPQSRIDYLRLLGAKVGDNTRFNCSMDFIGSEPYLVTIGEDCLFAGNVHIHTHDGGVKVLNSLDKFGGQRMNKMGKVTIGNNVFVGYGTQILHGVSIGDNVIIGANSVVSRSLPSNVVAIGCPAAPLCSIDEYYKKNIEKGVFYPVGDMYYSQKKDYMLNHIN